MSELSSTSWKKERLVRINNEKKKTSSLRGKTISLTRAICVHHIFIVHYLMKMLETPKFVGFRKKREMTFAYRYKKNIGNSREDKAYNT